MRRKFSLKAALETSASAAVIALLTANPSTVFAQDVGDEGDRTAVESADRGNQEDDIITVTATKREESIQEVPLAITALRGDFIADVNLNDAKDIILWTPGITGNSQDSFIDAVSVRGILTNDFGVGGDPSVGFFKNNLFQGRNGVAVTSLYDIERVEALRGPQNFLFGRNAIGGAINIHTKRPEFNSIGAYADVDIGERNHFVTEGAANFSTTDDFGVRFAGYFSTEDGWVDNVARPEDDPELEHDKWGIRGSASFKKDKLSVFFFAEYEDRDQDGTAYRAIPNSRTFSRLNELFGVTIGGDGRDIDQDMGYGGITDDSKIANLGLELNYDFGFATFTSLTGYQDHEYFYIEDFDGSPLQIADYLQDQEGDYFQQEVRLTSNTNSSLSWYAGASYYQENIKAFFEEKANEGIMCAYYLAAYYPSYSGAGALAYCQSYYGDPLDGELIEANQATGDYHGWAAYVNLNYKITDNFDVGVGIRYTEDTKDFSLVAFDVDSVLGPFYTLGFTTAEPIVGSKKWTAFTPQFVARYFFHDDFMVFGSVTRGYKAGGFGSFSVQEHPGDPPFEFGTTDVTNADVRLDPFEPEKAWSYEIGTKGRAIDRRLRYDVNAFYYDYKDLQLFVVGEGGGTRVDNVGKVIGWGIEGAFDFKFNDYIDIRLSAAHASTELTDAQAVCPGDDENACEGDSLSHVPDLSGAAAINFNYPAYGGKFLGTIELFGQTETSSLSASTDPAEKIDGYADITLRLGYKSDRGWGVIGYVENVTNELYYDGIFAGDGILPAVWFNPSRPRTFGVRLFASFGK